MANRDYGESRGGPGGGYDDPDRMGREGGRGWMDRARDYVERARDAGRDIYERERSHADRYGRGGPGHPGGQGYDRSDRGDYDRAPADRGYNDAGAYPGGGMPDGGARSGGSMGGNSYAGQGRPDLGDRTPSQGFTGGSGGGSGGSYYGQGTSGGGRPSYAGRGSKNYRRSDARIEEEVHELLMRHHEIDATDVDVRVADGEVTLTGEVEDRRAKRLAEEIVEQCPGVRDVHNQLRARRGLLGAVASAAMGAVDPAHPTRDRDVTVGTPRDVAAGSGSATAGGGTGASAGATAGLGQPGAVGTSGGTTDTGTR